MKPEKQIAERIVWQIVHPDSEKLPIEVALGPILDKVEKSNCKVEELKLIVSQDYTYGGGYHEDCIMIVSDRMIDNPDYDRQLAEYEQRIAQQRAEKLVWKNKAKQDLLDRIAKIDEEIEQLK